jgi:2-haloalkanoic acid dehalogenase type II
VVRLVSFDCYGTLIDWERGMREAVPGAPADFTSRYIEVEAEVEKTYRPYREILEIAMARMLDALGRPGDAKAFARSIVRWPPFPEVRAALEALKADGWRLAILSNVDDDIIAESVKLIGVSFDWIVTAQQVGSYKPAHGHWKRLADLAGEKRWLHIGASLYHDMAPAVALGLPHIWINRNAERATVALDGELPDLRGLPHIASRTLSSGL